MKENILQTNDLINDFIIYVLKFYNDKDGIYPTANKQTIFKCCDEFIKDSLENQKPLYFDSIDREEIFKKLTNQ
jgi:hypothetical protein